MSFSGFSPLGLRMDISCAIGFVVETGFYCVYTCLFFAAFPGMTRARRLKDYLSAKSARILTTSFVNLNLKVFLIFSILMYLVATTHLIFAAFRFYKSTFSTIDSNGAISYLLNSNHWEFKGLIILLCIQTWLGDALVIYRCYHIWDNFWLISIPTCLLLGTIGVYIYVVYLDLHPFITVPTPAPFLFRSAYPLALVQNFMTTGLIILKIFLQHQASKKVGVVDVGSKLSLIRIVRLLVESAALYTIQLLVLNILFFRGDSFQYVIQPAIIPSIGITFVLLAIRIEALRHESATTKNDPSIHTSIIPRWLREPEREIDSEDCEDDSSSPAGGGTAITEQMLSVHGESGTESINSHSNFLPDSATQSKANAISPLSSKNDTTCTSELVVKQHE